jgi:hypothetical protein
MQFFLGSFSVVVALLHGQSGAWGVFSLRTCSPRRPHPEPPPSGLVIGEDGVDLAIA